MSLADRLAVEMRPDPCATCRALAELSDDERRLFDEARPNLSQAAAGRVLEVSDSAFKRHVAAGHDQSR